MTDFNIKDMLSGILKNAGVSPELLFFLFEKYQQINTFVNDTAKEFDAKPKDLAIMFKANGMIEIYNKDKIVKEYKFADLIKEVI